MWVLPVQSQHCSSDRHPLKGSSQALSGVRELEFQESSHHSQHWEERLAVPKLVVQTIWLMRNKWLSSGSLASGCTPGRVCLYYYQLLVTDRVANEHLPGSISHMLAQFKASFWVSCGILLGKVPGKLAPGSPDFTPCDFHSAHFFTVEIPNYKA